MTVSPTPPIPPPFCWDASTRSTARPGMWRRPLAIRANMASFSIDATRTKSMTKSITLARALAFVSFAALLAGCQTSSRVEVAQSIPDDYRLRHPIAVREKVQSMTVFIGDARGTLTPTQRAEVGALASSWRQQATGGIVIEIPVGSPNERAAARASREIRSILAAAGVPRHAIE